MKYIYVLDKNKNPLMPTSNNARVRRWLKNKEAKIVCYKPFTIQLLKDTNNNKNDLILGIDPGRTNIGLCVVDKNNNEYFSSNVITRNKTIPKLMEDRLGARKSRRRYRRIKRQRRFKKFNPQMKNKIIMRRLPHFSVDVKLKLIKNKHSRFCNRKRKENWLTPTATQLLRTHINLIKKIQKFLPIVQINIEVNKFNIAKMNNNEIKNYEYAKGKLFGFKNKEEYIYHQQNGKCLFCNHDIEHYHHVIWKSRGGSDTVDNIAGVCFKHHDLIHKNKQWDNKCIQKHGGLLKKYGALSILNQIFPQLLKHIENILPINITTGYNTKMIREDMNLEKNHYIDAYCIAISSNNSKNISKISNYYDIKQFRRHDRKILDKILDRKYKYKKQLIATNRNKREGQQNTSWNEYLNDNRIINNITIEPGRKVYRNMNRYFPGIEFLYNNQRHISTGQSKGQYFMCPDFPKGYILIKKCKIIRKNIGLVFI